MKTIRVGMIGTGGISHWHIRQLKELDEVKLIAISDVSKESREKVVNEYELKVNEYVDHQEMLASESLDAVVICTPHTLHYQHAMDALNKGCHVLIEKPMATSLEETEKLLNAAEKLEKVLQVSYQRHFEPEYIYIKKAIADGVIPQFPLVT